MKAARIHLQVSSASPDLLAEMAALPAGRPRAARLRALAELGLRVERHLTSALVGADAASLRAPSPSAATSAAAAMASAPAPAQAPVDRKDLRRLVEEADPNDLIGGLLDSL